ncbi:ribosome-binding protein 1-like isoform X2 [Penaeus chinensis]|nr:ribosome-binding protein 1-like isoform X2 [Penaeus chinensis]
MASVAIGLQVVLSLFFMCRLQYQRKEYLTKILELEMQTEERQPLLRNEIGISHQTTGSTQAELIEAEEGTMKKREERWRDMNKTRAAQSTQGGRVEAAASKGPGVSQQTKGPIQAELIEAEEGTLKKREETWRDMNKTRAAQSTQGGRVEAAASKGPGVSQQTKGPIQAELIEAEEGTLKKIEETWRDMNKTRGAQSTQGGRVEAAALKGPGVSQQAKGPTQAELIKAEEDFLKEREEKWRDVNKTRGAQSTQGGRVEAAASKGPGVSQQAKGPTQAELIKAEEDFLKKRDEKWRDVNKTRGAQSTQGGRVEAAASKGPGVSQQAKGPTQAELIKAEDFLKEREEKWRDVNKTRGAQSTQGGRVEATASKGPGVSQQAKGPTQAELIKAEEDFLKKREEKWRDVNKTRGAQSTQGGRVEATASKGSGVSQQAKGPTQAELIKAEEDFLKEREEKWRDVNKTRGAQSTQGGRVEAAASKGPSISQQAKGPTLAELIEAEEAF